MGSIRLKISDLNSAESSEDIKRVLTNYEGVQNIMIDNDTGVAKIDYIMERITVDDLKRTIYEIGYEAE